jgi:two-component system response regulator
MLEVLLLEHNPMDADLISNTLKHINPNVRVEWVHTPQAALDFVFCTGAYSTRTPEQAPKLILLDVTVSETQVVDLLKILKAYARTRVLPVVVLTETANNTAFFAEANSCIVKTINTEDYRCAIEIVGHYWLTMNKSIDKLIDNSTQDGQIRATLPSNDNKDSSEQSNTANAYG